MFKRVLAGMATIVLCAPAAAAAEDWPAYRGGGGQNAFARSEPGADIGVLWRGGLTSHGDGWPSCVAVQDGRLYAVSSPAEDPSTARLSRVNVATGAVEWTTPPFPIGSSCPAVDQEHVYVSRWIDIAAYDIDDGSFVWRWDDGVPSGAPVADGDAVYLSGYGGPNGSDGMHFSLDADDGSLRWHDDDGDQTETPPLVSGDTVLFTTRSFGGLTAYDAATGARRWSDASASAFVAHDGVVYLSRSPDGWNRTLVARDAASGNELWARDLPAGQYPVSLVADDSGVYLRTSFQDGNLLGRVLAYHAATGTLRWNVASENLYDTRLVRFGGRLLSIGGWTGASYDVATGASHQLSGDFHFLREFAYADSTFYHWAASTPGSSVLEALRDVAPPALEARQPADGLVTADPTPTFEWAVQDGLGTGVSGVELLRDGQPPVALGAAGGSYESPPLADGVHRWRLRAQDLVGNTATTGERTLTVDTTPPSPFALRAPVGGAVLSDPRPTLQWEPAADATAVAYRVTLDGGDVAGAACAGQTCQVAAPGALRDGAHTWSVTATDAAGNVRESGGGAFSVSTGPAGTLGLSADVVATGAPVELQARFADPNGRIASYEWDLDGDGSFETRTSGDEPRATTRFATVGTRTLRVRASDDGGLSATASAQVEVRLESPRGELGISIEGGAIATNRREVQLTVVWPRLANEALISNDGGFGAAGSTALFPVATTIPWTLASSGPERLPKTVYLRFRGGEAGRETYTDDIILDERAPQLTAAAAVAPAAPAPSAGATPRRAARRAPRRTARRGQRRFRVQARDANSGVSAVQVSLRRSGRGAVTVRVVRPNARGRRSYAATVKVKLPAGRAWVRVLDAAGNASKWRRAR